MKELCDETIVKQIKVAKKKKAQVNFMEKPSCFRGVALDILSGVKNKNLTVEEHFSKYYGVAQGSLSQQEFEQALSSLDIDLSQKVSYLSFRYLLDAQYQKTLEPKTMTMDAGNDSNLDNGELSDRQLVKSDMLDIDYLQQIL